MAIPRNKLVKIDLIEILQALPSLERLDLAQNYIDELLPPALEDQACLTLADS